MDTAVPSCEVVEKVSAIVPPYMVPRRITVMDSLPKNANGKIDGAEFEAVRKDSAGTPDLNLKALDKDHDGKLSETEVAALGGAKKAKKKK